MDSLVVGQRWSAVIHDVVELSLLLEVRIEVHHVCEKASLHHLEHLMVFVVLTTEDKLTVLEEQTFYPLQLRLLIPKLVIFLNNIDQIII